MNQHRTKMIARKHRAWRRLSQRKYDKPTPGYDLSNTRRKELGL